MPEGIAEVATLGGGIDDVLPVVEAEGTAETEADVDVTLVEVITKVIV